jgi:hypothetical protein
LWKFKAYYLISFVPGLLQWPEWTTPFVQYIKDIKDNIMLLKALHFIELIVIFIIVFLQQTIDIGSLIHITLFHLSDTDAISLFDRYSFEFFCFFLIKISRWKIVSVTCALFFSWIEIFPKMTTEIFKTCCLLLFTWALGTIRADNVPVIFNQLRGK